MRVLLRWILLGVGLGVASAVSPGGFFLFLLAGGITAGLLRQGDPLHRRWKAGLFLGAFLIRVGLSLGLDALSYAVERERPLRYADPQGWDLGIRDRTREYIRMGDSDYLSQRGYAYAQYARGNREPVVVYRVQEEYGWNGYVYLVGAFYSLFGYSPIAVKWINALLGAGLVVLIFLLAQRLFHTTVARWAAVAVALWPSLVFWSASNLKESGLVYLTALGLWAFVQIRDVPVWSARIRWGVVFALAMAVHMTLRSEVYTGALVAAGGLGWLLAGPGRLRWRIPLLFLLAAAAVQLKPDVPRMFYQILYVHLGHFYTPGVGYQYVLPGHYVPGYIEAGTLRPMLTPLFMFETTLRALAHYFIEPLPKRMDTLTSLAWYPVMILWYFLLPFMAWGAGRVLWGRFRQAFFLLLFIGAWAVLGALTNGNVGTVFRMRDMLTPFLLMLAAFGVWSLGELFVKRREST